MSSSLSKRKLDDYVDENLTLLPLSPTRMRKEQIPPLPISPPPSPTTRSSFALDIGLQFFVRTFTHNTLVLHADPGDTVESVHRKIRKITGIPVMEQRLIYRGKQLQWEQTLAGCDVQKDANLHLVGRMRSTGHPQAWQLVNDVVSSVFSLLKNTSLPLHLSPHPQPLKSIKNMLLEFLSMTPKESEKASEHLQILSASSAPAALVMLYMSDHKPNKEAGEDAIRQFICRSKHMLPSGTYDRFVPINLEFCRLLKRATGVDDRLYCVCRSSLAVMMESIDLKDRELISLRDISSFVSELAVKVSAALVSFPDFISAWSLDEVVCDFSKFMLAMRIAIMQDNSFLCPIEVSLISGSCKAPLFYPEEIATLHGIFEDLLSKLDICLGKVDENLRLLGTDGLPISVSFHYLSILKELNSVSKLFCKCEGVFWETMKSRKDTVNYLIVRDVKRSDDCKWIMEHKEVTNFESRRHLAMLLLPEAKDEFEELHEMLIDRANLLSESFEYIGRADPESLRAGLFMEFKNEEATGPGILREWFLVVCQAIFNPQNALFVACPGDHRRFFPNPASKVEPLHLDYFKFAGRIIALALMHKIQIGIVFDRVFYLLLAEGKISLEDIRDADPYMYSSCKQILAMDPEAIDQDTLGLTFVYEVEELGTRNVVELCCGGINVVVNSENRGRYVDSLIEYRFLTSISEQVEHFAQGFTDIMSCKELKRCFFQCLDPEDFEAILYGSERDISVDDWKTHTEYHGFKETDDQISWFWKVVESMTPDQKKVLLFFWTSIKFLPVEGFRGLASHLYIYKTTEPFDLLPSSHTCFYRLCFPAYPSLAVMHDRLSIITQEHIGCSFGTW